MPIKKEKQHSNFDDQTLLISDTQRVSSGTSINVSGGSIITVNVNFK